MFGIEILNKTSRDGEDNCEDCTNRDKSGLGI